MTGPSTTLRTFESIMMSMLAYFLFSMIDAIQKYMGSEGFTVTTILVYSAATSLILSTGSILIFRGWKGFIPQKSLKLHLFRAGLMVIGSYSIVTALQLIPLAQFYGVMFSIPFMVGLGAVFVFKEHPGFGRWVCIIGGFIGVWISANPDLSNIEPGIIWAFIAAFCITCSSLVVRKMGTGEFMPLYPFFIHSGIVLMNVPFLESLVTPNLFDTALFVLCGVALFFAVISLTISYTIAPMAAIVAPFQYSQILWGVFIGYLVFQEIPTTQNILGICVIILFGLLMIWLEYKTYKANIIR